MGEARRGLAGGSGSKCLRDAEGEIQARRNRTSRAAKGNIDILKEKN
jgi:hypothetical protein